LNLQPLPHHGWLILLLIALALITLTGCQGVAGNSQNNNAGALSASPATLSFGSIPVGKSASISATLANTGGSAVTVSQANIDGAGFAISGLTLPMTLNPGHSVTFTSTFAPTAKGTARGTLAIVSDAVNSPLNIALSGTGTTLGQLSVSPATLNFGNVVVGANSSRNGSLTATAASVTVSSASSNSSEFVLSGMSLPITIQAGQSAPFTVTFAPNATGTASATLTFASNASNSPTVESLAGNGTAPPQHWVDLTWSPSAGAVSYNIYRKLPTKTNYMQINSGEVNPAYTDNNVTAGTTYDYVVTAVDANNVESGYSNLTQVTIPSP
jgi:hypothetical protein